MPLAVIIAVIAVVAAYLAAHALGAVLAAHLAAVITVIALVLIAAAGIAAGLIRGARRHTVVAWAPRALPAPRRELPAPAAPVALAPAALTPQDPFTADGPAWADLIEQAEREELQKQGPREARVTAAACKGPGCGAELDDNPWTAEFTVDGSKEAGEFCSRECAESWEAERVADL